MHQEHAIGTLHWQYYDRLNCTSTRNYTLTVLWQTDCTCTHAMDTLHWQYYDRLIAHAQGTRYGHTTLTVLRHKEHAIGTTPTVLWHTDRTCTRNTLWHTDSIIQTDCTKQGTRYRHITLTVLWQTDCTHDTLHSIKEHAMDTLHWQYYDKLIAHAQGTRLDTLHWQYYDRLIALNKEHAIGTLHWQYYDRLIAHAQGTRYGHITLTVLWQTDCTCTRNTLWTHYTDSIMTSWSH